MPMNINEEVWSLGNVVNIHSGDWVGPMSGIGAGVDSFYEYLLKVIIYCYYYYYYIIILVVYIVWRKRRFGNVYRILQKYNEIHKKRLVRIYPPI